MLFDNSMEYKDTPDCYNRLRQALAEADTVILGAGAGLSASAGFAYAGERFKQYFSDFEAKYGFRDMYTGGFVVMKCPPEGVTPKMRIPSELVPRCPVCGVC
jgi:spermidine synthase